MLAHNHPLYSLGAQFSKIKSINKQLSLLAVDRLYAMAKAVMPKSSLEAISLEGGFILSVLLIKLGINENKIISRIPNCIPSPSNLRYVVKKSRADKFMRIAGFVCNSPCSI